ncbi:MAG TPA: hypothetical protein VEA38_06655 [Terriglobales bacterium]|nr:hypothetical protein [Terriglobales bacterium]
MKARLNHIGRKRVAAARCRELFEFYELRGPVMLSDGTLQARERTPRDILIAQVLFAEWNGLLRDLRDATGQ